MKTGFDEMMETIVPSDTHRYVVIKQCASVIQNKPIKLTRINFFIAQFYFLKPLFWIWQMIAMMIGMLLTGYCKLHHQDALLRFTLSFSVIVIHLLSTPVLVKSIDYNTVELENATYIPYRYALLSKMMWIGLSNLFVISIFMLFTTGVFTLSLEQILLYMLVPYNITCFISLAIVYAIRHAQAIYCCVISNVVFSILLFLLSNTKYYMDTSYLFLWRILFIISIISVFIIILKILQQVEHKKITLYERRCRLWN